MRRSCCSGKQQRESDNLFAGYLLLFACRVQDDDDERLEYRLGSGVEGVMERKRDCVDLEMGGCGTARTVAPQVVAAL